VAVESYRNDPPTLGEADPALSTQKVVRNRSVESNRIHFNDSPTPMVDKYVENDRPAGKRPTSVKPDEEVKKLDEIPNSSKCKEKKPVKIRVIQVKEADPSDMCTAPVELSSNKSQGMAAGKNYSLEPAKERSYAKTIVADKMDPFVIAPKLRSAPIESIRYDSLTLEDAKHVEDNVKILTGVTWHQQQSSGWQGDGLAEALSVPPDNNDVRKGLKVIANHPGQGEMIVIADQASQNKMEIIPDHVQEVIPNEDGQTDRDQIGKGARVKDSSTAADSQRNAKSGQPDSIAELIHGAVAFCAKKNSSGPSSDQKVKKRPRTVNRTDQCGPKLAPLLEQKVQPIERRRGPDALNYGYQRPEKLTTNPPKIKTCTKERYEKFRYDLRDVTYNAIPQKHVKWTDCFLPGNRIRYVEYHGTNIPIKIGSGTYRDVYLGITDNDRLVAIKLFKVANTDRDNLAKEAVISQHLTGTGCTPEFYGLIVLKSNSLYHRVGLVLEHIGGAHLNTYRRSQLHEIFCEEVKRYHKQRAPLVPKTEWIRICHNLASGLANIHDRGIIQNDIKLDNIFLNATNGCYDPVLIDFGLSRAAKDKPFYIDCPEEKRKELSNRLSIAPEVYTGGHASFASDVYALGDVLKTLDGIIFNFRLRHITRLCLQDDPEKRPSARQLADMLRKI
jgi:predicted Ser/Thr protein kinase